MKTIALVGQPNCGKSTLFNQIAGYKSLAANFPGATVTYTKGTTYINSELVEVIDLPGTYSLSWYDDAEKETVRALFSMDIDVIVNIIDASMLIRSVELTLELMALEKPMVVALNMMDEAEKKGICIDVKRLEDVLGVKVVPIIARKGKGIKALFESIKNASKPRKRCIYSRKVEEGVDKLIKCMGEYGLTSEWPPKLLAIKAIEGFKPCARLFGDTPCEDLLKKVRAELDDGMVIVNQRHALCMEIFESVAKVKKIKKRRIDVDDLLMHPILGYIIMLLIFAGIFYAVFRGGVPIENLVMKGFASLDDYLATIISSKLLLYVVKGAVDGMGAAIGIALPYLLPFLFLISLLEDVGYLPRIAYLMDSTMHKMGVHGTSVIPFVAGYGCSVPAVMATRILKSKKEKYITAFLASMVPCSARTTVIMGLAGYFLGYVYVAGLYLLNLIVIMVSGVILKRFLPGVSPEMIIDIPPYRLPSLKTLLLKTWQKVKDFVYLAVPMLIIGSIVLTLINYYGLDSYINAIFAPFMEGVLGLPAALGVVLIFGILKKELTLIMMYQALGLSTLAAVSGVLSHIQILTFTVFVMFYVPCVATIAAIAKEVGAKASASMVAGTLLIATILALMVRFFAFSI